MKSVKIAELKAKLSSYLRYVKAGNFVTIYDRDTPLADLVPHNDTSQIVVSQPTGDLRTALRNLPKRKRVTRARSSLELLTEERTR